LQRVQKGFNLRPLFCCRAGKDCYWNKGATCTSFKIDERVCDKRVGSISRGIGVDEERIVAALSVFWRPMGKPVSR
jgi:hypothetical protein